MHKSLKETLLNIFNIWFHRQNKIVFIETNLFMLAFKIPDKNKKQWSECKKFYD